MTEWIDLNKELPKLIMMPCWVTMKARDGRYVLVAYWLGNNKWSYHGSVIYSDEIAAWMPIEEPDPFTGDWDAR